MSASTTPRRVPAASVKDAVAEPSVETVAQTPVEPTAPRGAAAADWVTAAVVFAILGGCLALWLADLSLVIGAFAAMVSGLIGILFADW